MIQPLNARDLGVKSYSKVLKLIGCLMFISSLDLSNEFGNSILKGSALPTSRYFFNYSYSLTAVKNCKQASIKKNLSQLMCWIYVS